tara:strand:- start:7918 stop:8652 length:735 start_codon:yes stop_codon:yes gene_type:complete
MYKEFLEFLNTKKNVLVLGKGHLNKKITKHYDLYIGIKQSIGILKQKDILVMNDFEGIFGIEEFIPEIKYILCPNMLHIKHQPVQEYNLKLYNYLDKLGFKGKIINYEIETNKRPNKNLDFINCKNSGEVIFHFLNPKHNIDIYGMYNCLDDNLSISKLILNRKYNKEYINEYNKEYINEYNTEYNDYLQRIYKNKRGINLLMYKNTLDIDLNMLKTNRDFKLLMSGSQKRIILQYPKLNINFI